ncbi:DUF6415 family natural product biosynthesis protein [Streptomyces sp. NPDC091292]|uniref:DUF6415 family natural product biosynthesis protein n=1 Tax=Streptomyces sp. NPDC091292 TaxID=3365991 RepID=UPI003819050B
MVSSASGPIRETDVPDEGKERPLLSDRLTEWVRDQPAAGSSGEGTSGTSPLDTAAMLALADSVLSETADPPTRNELDTLRAQLRGALMQLVPAVEDAARTAQHAGPPLRAMLCVGEARGRLDLTPGPSLSAEVKLTQSLARSVQALAGHLEQMRTGSRHRAVEAWHPPQGISVQLVNAGRYWDAVRVPQSIGEPARARLRDASGAVIRDGYALAMYWLVLPDTVTARGRLSQHVQVLGDGTYVAVPPVHWTDRPGLEWMQPPTPHRYLTDADALTAVLDEELHTALGPR